MTYQIPHVLIVGHCFIKRLKQGIITDQTLHPSFNLMRGSTQCYGVIGATLPMLSQHTGLLRVLENFQPNIVILQIGGNDICDPQLRPETLACQKIDFMSDLKQTQSVQEVVVCELFPRYNPWYITAERYEFKRIAVNQVLRDMLSEGNNLSFWKHRRLINSPLKIIRPEDGVHLTDIGTKKFYRSLRLAILHALDLV